MEVQVLFQTASTNVPTSHLLRERSEGAIEWNKCNNYVRAKLASRMRNVANPSCPYIPWLSMAWIQPPSTKPKNSPVQATVPATSTHSPRKNDRLPSGEYRSVQLTNPVQDLLVVPAYTFSPLRCIPLDAVHSVNWIDIRILLGWSPTLRTRGDGFTLGGQIACPPWSTVCCRKWIIFVEADAQEYFLDSYGLQDRSGSRRIRNRFTSLSQGCRFDLHPRLWTSQ